MLQSMALTFILLLSCITPTIYCMNKPKKQQISKKINKKNKREQEKKQKDQNDLAFLNECAEKNKKSNKKPTILIQKGYKDSQLKKQKRTSKQFKVNPDYNPATDHIIDDNLMDALYQRRDNQQFTKRLMELVFSHYGYEEINDIGKELVDQFIWQVEQSFKEEEEEQLTQQFIQLHVQEDRPQSLLYEQEQEEAFGQEEHETEESSEKKRPELFEDGLFYIKN